MSTLSYLCAPDASFASVSPRGRLALVTVIAVLPL